MIVLALFVTGVAQTEIIPRLQARAERAIEQAKHRVISRGEAPAAASADSALAAEAAAADSALALASQMETQRLFLEAQAARVEAAQQAIDSLVQSYQGRQDVEVKRQAKLLAAMKPVEAARILDAMDDASINRLLANMNARAASGLLARLDAQRAARLSLAAVGEGNLAGDVLGREAAEDTSRSY